MPAQKKSKKRKSSRDSARVRPRLLEPLQGPELVFGLVGPIGTDLTLVGKKLGDALAQVGYRAVYVHITDALKEFRHHFPLSDRPTEDRYRTYMDAGNKLRARLDRQDALALFAVAKIRRERSLLSGDRLIPQPFAAYILNQFKRPEEIETLRRVYGRGFIQISAYCSREKRLDDLTNRIAKSHYRQKNVDAYRGKAQDLISRDDDEEEEPFGQRLRDTFALADVVIDADSEDKIISTCNRFVRGFFSDNFCTPSRDEFAMYMAKSASLRSSDLSRQVGAAIFNDAGEIISVGCNEVPRAGGGAYWEGEASDFRDFRVGYDSSARAKREILEDLFRRLKAGSWFSRERSQYEIEALIDEAIGQRGILRDAQVMNSLEFGRVVHAEMLALSEAVRHGISTANATLYCTTFPCHICAKHIVAAGIKRVVYIEPYSKSLASELFPDSIEVEGQSKRDGARVRFEPFIGVAPERYPELFRKGRRKDKDGKPILWQANTANPILQRLVPAYLQIETTVVDAVARMLKDARLSPARI